MAQNRSYNQKGSFKKGGKRRTNKRNYRETTPRDSKVEMDKEDYISSKNDWRWYATNPQLIKDSASYPFGYALGTRVNYGPYGTEASKSALPGVCSLAFTPTVGYSDHTNSPINIASRKIYSDIRHTNSGSANYDPVDMMQYLVGMDSCYFMLEHYKRAYGVARSVSPVNRYYPVALVEAMGFDYDSLVANLDDFRAMINTYAQKLKSLVIPNGMSYMAKHQWMCAGVYQDRPTDKSQLYIFIPKTYYVYGLDTDGAGCLYGREWTRVNFAQAQQVLNDILDPLLANQDFSIMSGDILKWRGEGGIVVPTGITETYQVFPTYDESVLDQIQNATLVGECTYASTLVAPGTTSQIVITQDANKEYLKCNPLFKHAWHWNSNDPNPGRNSYMSRKLLNFVHDNVQPEEVMEASRLTNIASDFSQIAGYDYFHYHTMGSEVLNDAYFWYYHQNNSGTWRLDSWRVKNMSDVLVLTFPSSSLSQSDFTFAASEISDFLFEIQMISDFNRHPFFAITAGIADDTGTLNAVYSPFRGYLGDMDYYTILDEQDLVQMSEVALLSEFNVRMER